MSLLGHISLRMSPAPPFIPQRSKLKKLPQHIAVILDGNGRWAKQRNYKRSQGHRAGAERLNELLEFVLDLGIPCVSLYAFSTENWKRPQTEIRSLWKLLDEYFTQNLQRCLDLGIQVRVAGDMRKLPQRTQKQLQGVVSQTARQTKMIANFCINYGAHEEILQACQNVINSRLALYAQKESKRAAAKLTKKEFEKQLYTFNLSPVDLLIRPGGEYRISNFLLWQCAYAELYFSSTLWPDFSAQELWKALLWFQERQRRYGGLE